jgi:GT2 family glycosyltransferase
MTMPKCAIGPHGERIILDQSSMISKRPIISIIIPCLANDENLDACVTSVLDTTQDLQVEVIVVDDSGDENHHYRYDNIWIVKNEKNLGFAGACNRAVEMASGRYFLFLNSDTFVFDGWLKEMLKTAGNMMSGIEWYCWFSAYIFRWRRQGTAQRHEVG